MGDLDFDPEMFANFDFSEFMDSEVDPNIFNYNYNNPDAPSDQTDNPFNTPVQYADGIAAPPPSPLQQDVFMSEAGFGPCVWCDAPHDTDHDPGCPLLIGPGRTLTGDDPGAEASPSTMAPSSVAASSPEMTVLTSAWAPPQGPATGNDFAASTIPGMLPTPAPQPALPAYVSPYARQPYPMPASQPTGPAYVSPYPRAPYPMPASIPPATHDSLPVRPRAAAPKPGRQPKTPAVQPSVESDSEPLEYHHRFNDFDAARQALIQPVDVDRLIPLGLTTDDWQEVKAHHIHDSSARLFEALHAEPGPPPDNFTDDQTVYYYEHQDIVRQSVLNKIHADPRKAEARTMMLLEEIINVHEHGVPKSVWERRDIKSGYLLEADLPCSQRLADVIKAVDNDKYVALDVLSGTGLADLARSPARYLRRKHENCRVNARKAFEKQKAEEAKRNGVAPNKTPAAPTSRAPKKTAKGKQPAQNSSPRTPTPSLPTTQVPLDQTLHQQYAQAGEASRPQQKRKAEVGIEEALKRFKYKEAEDE
ncbi:hypothetical protein PRZ48_014029 [Zasmidium cellare]|uniref:Uncharacterized protein n=1 Tax=Zasmidium cellare TaxID=395010 RepID=A0ABR0DZT0_ZASCE|nr:hypothetical protein PRZ48_014029 [Zasmidium cellare]